MSTASVRTSCSYFKFRGFLISCYNNVNFFNVFSPATAAPISLGRAADNKCAGVSIECPICQGFSERTFNVTKKNAVFVATVGPTGGQRGYTSIAGRSC